MIFKNPKIVYLFLILGLLWRLVISVQIYSGDVNNHIAWGRDSIDNGFSGIYEREFMKRYGVLTPTYPPIPIFMFTLFHWFYDWTYKTSWNLNLSVPIFPSKFIFFLENQNTLPAFTKIPAIFADIGIAFIVYLFAQKMFKNKKLSIFSLLLVLFNPAFFYDSAYWGQIEAVPLFFVLLSFYFLLYLKKPKTSCVIFVLALLSKQTSIIFMPIFVIVFLRKFSFREWVKSGTASLVVFLSAFLPFYKTGNLFLFPFKTYLEKIQTGSGSDFVTDHAFNIWALLKGLGKISDSEIFFANIPYNFFGYFIFGMIFMFVIWQVYKKYKKPSIVILALGLLGFSAFLFLTRMHERYLEQALPFLLLSSLKSKKLLLVFIGLSVFHFANLYHNWWAPRVDNLVSLLEQRWVINTLIIFAISSFLFLFIQYIKEVYE